MRIKRGEVYYADLSPVVGSEQGGVRPVLIIQNDVGNNHSPTVIVSPMTTKAKNGIPTHVKISTHCGIREDSVIMLEQIRTIDKTRLQNFICCLPDDVMSKVDKAMEISLALYKEETHSEKEDTMSELQIFNNEEFGEIRTVVENGEPMFCLSDVCKALELTQPSKVRERLSEKGVNSIPTLTKGGTQNLLYINEANLYKTIFQSRKESAERFSDWVAGEVLPQIRKNGYYQQKPMTIPEQIKLLAQGNVELEKKVYEVDKRIDTLEQDMPLYGCEIDEVQAHVRRKGVKVLGGKQSEAYKDASIRGSIYSDIYRELKRQFGLVTSYKSIKRKYMADIHELIDCYEPPIVLAEQIDVANT